MKIGSRQLVGIVVVCVLLIGAGFGLANLRRQVTPAPIEIIPPSAAATLLPVVTPNPSPTPAPLHVYVSGAVALPAVYNLPPGSIIDDAVRAAGGFVDGADTVAINLAQAVTDGMQVHVPLLGTVTAAPPPISQPAAATSSSSRMGGVTVTGLININTAVQTELEMLPGIGPATATHIITHREANGPFATIEAIMDVPGIGEGKFEAIRELITVGP